MSTKAIFKKLQLQYCRSLVITIVNLKQLRHYCFTATSAILESHLLFLWKHPLADTSALKADGTRFLRVLLNMNRHLQETAGKQESYGYPAGIRLRCPGYEPFAGESLVSKETSPLFRRRRWKKVNIIVKLALKGRCSLWKEFLTEASLRP